MDVDVCLSLGCPAWGRGTLLANHLLRYKSRMMEFFGKALDLLKASGWQTAGIAAASALFIYFEAKGVAPAAGPTVILAMWIVLFISAGLAISSCGPTVQRAVTAQLEASRSRKKMMAAENEFRRYVPYLSDKERQIFGYLLNKRMKSFTADHDGGYAASLLARGYIRYIGARGQSFDLDKCPLAVPEHVWKVLEENSSEFAYKPDLETGYEAEPWRIPWGVR